MRRSVFFVLSAVLLATMALAGKSVPALAATHDGAWSVLVITERGDCDQAYRYEVSVSSGHVRYVGNAAVQVAGTVSNGGTVNVSISGGGRVARGTGKLSGTSGAGTWRGESANGACTGRWEAARV
jgi:hypothetical protein